MRYSIIKLVALILFCSCASNRPLEKIAVTVMPDPTDSLNLQPDASEITEQFQFYRNPDIEAYYQLLPITSSKLNTPVNFHLSNSQTTEKLSDDPDGRQLLINEFTRRIDASLIEYHQKFDTVRSLPKSHCYYTISSEIVHLHALGCTKTHLLVYSDLLENSDLLCCYQPKDSTLILRNPDEVAQKLLKAGPLPDSLNELTVTLYYLTDDETKAKLFLAMVEIYRRVLCPRGAKIVVPTANKIYQP